MRNGDGFLEQQRLFAFSSGPHHDLISTPFLSLSPFFYSIYNSQSPLRRWLRGRRPAARPPRRDRGEPGVEVRKSTDNLQKKVSLIYIKWLFLQK